MRMPFKKYLFQHFQKDSLCVYMGANTPDASSFWRGGEDSKCKERFARKQRTLSGALSKVPRPQNSKGRSLMKNDRQRRLEHGIDSSPIVPSRI